MENRYQRFTGSEEFCFEGKPIGKTATSFWSWAYSELENNIVRSVLAEYIVAEALSITEIPGEDFRQMWRPYDLMFEGMRIEVKSASTVQSWETRHKGKYTFKIAPARLLDPVLGYIDEAPQQRNCDIYVFCVFEPKDESLSPLNLDAWYFYAIATKIFDEKIPNQKSISLESLKMFNPVKTDFMGLKGAIIEIKKTISNI